MSRQSENDKNPYTPPSVPQENFLPEKTGLLSGCFARYFMMAISLPVIVLFLLAILNAVFLLQRGIFPNYISISTRVYGIGFVLLWTGLLFDRPLIYIIFGVYTLILLPCFLAFAFQDFILTNNPRYAPPIVETSLVCLYLLAIGSLSFGNARARNAQIKNMKALSSKKDAEEY